MRGNLLGPVLVVAGLVIVGQVALDDTGDDIGGLSVDAADTADDGRPDDGIGTLAEGVTSRPDPATSSAADRTRDGAAADADDQVDDDSARPETEADTATDAATATAPERSLPRIGTSSARLEDLDLTRPPAPTDIALPAIGIEAPVVAVGVDDDGLMTVPEDVLTVGWYEYGGAPGSAEGTTVLAGHVDSRTQGRGAFFELRSLEIGDAVAVADEDGGQSVWRVTGRRTYDKSSLPIDDLYRRDGSPRLVLITCGGDFDDVDRHYESNVVVEAEPIS